ncbi:MAG: hypothetical protein ACLT9P_06530 [Evtepia gabavorous]
MVLAVGAAPAVPPVPGIDSPKVIDCVTALTGPDLPGQRVLVVGGGLVARDRPGQPGRQAGHLRGPAGHSLRRYPGAGDE